MNRLTFSSPYPKQKDFLLSRARYIAQIGCSGESAAGSSGSGWPGTGTVRALMNRQR